MLFLAVRTLSLSKRRRDEPEWASEVLDETYIPKEESSFMHVPQPEPGTPAPDIEPHPSPVPPDREPDIVPEVDPRPVPPPVTPPPDSPPPVRA